MLRKTSCLIIALMFGLATLSFTQSPVNQNVLKNGFSSPEDQFIQKCFDDPRTKNLWVNLKFTPGPNQTLVYDQKVSFWLNNRIVTTTPAKPGCNTAWCLAGKYYQDSIAPSLAPQAPVTPTYHPITQASFLNFVNWILGSLWFWLILVLLLGYLAYRWATRWKKLSPTQSGPKMVEDGVTDQTVRSAFERQAQDLHPGQKWNVTNIRRGRLFGQGLVFYAGQETGQRRDMTPAGQRGYAATLTKDGKTEEVFCIQVCGNDARNGEYMTGLRFVPDLDGDLPDPVSETEATSSNLPAVPSVAVFAFAKELAEGLLANDVNGRMTFELNENGIFIFRLVNEPYPHQGH